MSRAAARVAAQLDSAAARVASGTCTRARARAWARHELVCSGHALDGAVAHFGADAHWAVLDLAHAAAIAAWGVGPRTVLATAAARAARAAKRFDAARDAYVDAIEGIEIASRWLGASDPHVARAVETLIAGWESASGEPSAGEPDLASEWRRDLDLWIDRSGRHGDAETRADIDAVARLALRIERWGGVHDGLLQDALDSLARTWPETVRAATLVASDTVGCSSTCTGRAAYLRALDASLQAQLDSGNSIATEPHAAFSLRPSTRPPQALFVRRPAGRRQR